MSCQPGVSSCLSQNGVLAGRLKMLKTFHQYFIHDQQQLDLLQDVEIPVLDSAASEITDRLIEETLKGKFSDGPFNAAAAVC